MLSALIFLLPIFFILLVILTPVIIITVILSKREKEYLESTYYKITKLPYHNVKYNLGRYGEYLIYQNLKHLEANGAKFLFNLYIPKSNGETSEIDVIMIYFKCVFVFESKNFSGWIFGDESKKTWCQTLPKSKGVSQKSFFPNPILQNNSHIKHLRTILGEQIPFKSLIVFSDRCSLKSIKLQSNTAGIINRYRITPVVSAICNMITTSPLTEADIDNIYNKLYPYSQVDSTVKEQHITNICNNINPQPIAQTTPSNTVPVESTKSAHAPMVEVEAITQDIQPIKCPKCNGNLILRTATRGAYIGNHFYGCSNYPKCNYIQNLK